MYNALHTMLTSAEFAPDDVLWRLITGAVNGCRLVVSEGGYWLVGTGGPAYCTDRCLIEPRMLGSQCQAQRLRSMQAACAILRAPAGHFAGRMLPISSPHCA